MESNDGAIPCESNLFQEILLKMNLPDHRIKQRWRWRHLVPVESIHHPMLTLNASKFFYQSALRWFPNYWIRTLDAVVITHSHADAIGGLDDLRDWTNNVQPHIPIYVTERDFEAQTVDRFLSNELIRLVNEIKLVFCNMIAGDEKDPLLSSRHECGHTWSCSLGVAV
ncbi:putative hydrolase [Tanacetum coccineum]